MISDESRPSAAIAEPRTNTTGRNLGSELRRYVPLLVWMVVILTLLWIPGKIVSYGYIPHDDALRHAAKAVSGKPWPEIMVMRDDFRIDPHPGWHAVLGAIHKLTGSDAEKLVMISVVGMMLLVSAAALPWLRWPESWLAAMLVATICMPRISARLVLGRPYLFTVAACIALIYVWSRIQQRRPRAWELAFTVVVVALDAWIHGGWYQMGLPIAALVLCGWWRPAIWYGACFLGGSILGCAFTGHPWLFLFQSSRHLLGVFGDFHVDRELSTELLPSGGDPQMVLAVVAMILWRMRSPGWSARELLNPVFMMAIIGWVLGLKMYRFWDDWGLTAAMLWIALELQKEFAGGLAFDSARRLVLAAGLGGALFLASTSDINSRYTWNLTNEYLEEKNPELTGWLPEKGGILYSAEMSVFFETFYKNPTAPWKYILGFESALMRPEDLQVYRKIQWNFGDVRGYEPWVKKMKPEDRLVIRASRLHSGNPPNIPELEWRYAVTDLWVGRLPRDKK